MRSTGGAVELTDHVPTPTQTASRGCATPARSCSARRTCPRWSGDLQTYNEIFGTTNNPWDLERVPGGSSGGAATSVALGFTSFEIGTDIGGSIRVPSATAGSPATSRATAWWPPAATSTTSTGGFTEPDVNVHGPIARSVDDLELLLGVLAGPAPTGRRPGGSSCRRRATTAIADYRVALWADDAACPVSGRHRGCGRGGGRRWSTPAPSSIAPPAPTSTRCRGAAWASVWSARR